MKLQNTSRKYNHLKHGRFYTSLKFIIDTYEKAMFPITLLSAQKFWILFSKM